MGRARFFIQGYKPLRRVATPHQDLLITINSTASMWTFTEVQKVGFKLNHRASYKPQSRLLGLRSLKGYLPWASTPGSLPTPVLQIPDNSWISCYSIQPTSESNLQGLAPGSIGLRVPSWEPPVPSETCGRGAGYLNSDWTTTDSEVAAALPLPSDKLLVWPIELLHCKMKDTNCLFLYMDWLPNAGPSLYKI